MVNLVEVSNVQRGHIVAPGETIELSVSVPKSLVPHSRAVLRSRADSTAELHLRSVGETHVEFIGEWTAPEKEMYVVHHWALHTESQELYALEQSTATEVTCSDGEYCNGMERYINGRCQSAKPACEDDDPCTNDICDETTKRCMNKAVANRPDCICFSDCEIDCEGKECGEDGCGGFCGTCEDGKGCASGVCVLAEVDGTCTQPIPLLDSEGYANFFTQTHFVEGDTSNGINTYFPSCNTLSGAQELFYEVVVPSTGSGYVGVEMTMTGFDSVLQLQEGVCGGTVIACSDDSTPPGYLGSRVKASLERGKTYLFMADGYNLEQKGPFELRFHFHENCLPDCDGLFCGDDGCGGSCGECEGAERCNSGSCYPNPCTPNCASDNRECGDDGCGGSCGECDVDSGSYCITDVDEDGNVFYTGQCTEPVVPCDHFNPVCGGGCNSGQFCASDCVCYDLNEPLPDLVIDVDLLSTEIYVEIANFSNTSCAVAEGCATGTVSYLFENIQFGNL